MTTIEKINKTVGRETQHPLICVVGDCPAECEECVVEKSDCYSLTVTGDEEGAFLHLSVPGERQPAVMGRGVYFHPDLLCDTPLESRMAAYPRRCRCHGCLTSGELDLIDGCFVKISEELCHPIDRHSAAILSSHLELLLNYCVKICN